MVDTIKYHNQEHLIINSFIKGQNEVKNINSMTPKNVWIKKLADNVFLIFNKNSKEIISYHNNKWEELLNLKKIKEIKLIQTTLSLVWHGYWYVESWNKKKLYPISCLIDETKWMNIEYSKWNCPVEIDEFSLESYKVWSEAFFYYIRYFIKSNSEFKNSPHTLKNTNLPSFKELVLKKYIKISDLVDFFWKDLKSNRATANLLDYITKPNSLGRTVLEDQIVDYRFNVKDDWITKEELKMYFENWYITPFLYEKCIKLLEKEKDKTEKNIFDIHTLTQLELSKMNDNSNKYKKF